MDFQLVIGSKHLSSWSLRPWLVLKQYLRIRDSLAIREYLAERFPEKKLWPEAADDRALARSVSAERRAGFASMRPQLSMDLLRRVPTPDLPPETAAAQREA